MDSYVYNKRSPYLYTNINGDTTIPAMTNWRRNVEANEW